MADEPVAAEVKGSLSLWWPTKVYTAAVNKTSVESKMKPNDLPLLRPQAKTVTLRSAHPCGCGLTEIPGSSSDAFCIPIAFS